MSGRPAVAPLRSVLFVPATRPDWVPRAADAGADAVVLDLEDATPQHLKDAARQHVVDVLDSGPPLPVLVRVNGLHDITALADLQAVVRPGLTGVMVPKVESAADVALVDRLLGWLEPAAGMRAGQVLITPILETAAGMQQAVGICGASSRVAYAGGLGVRGGDVQRSLGYRWSPTGTETSVLRAVALRDVRAAGVPNPVSGLWTDVADINGLRAFGQANRDLGYEGMLVIHPSHVAVVNELFTPTADELDADEDLVTAVVAAARAGRGAAVHDGQMVDAAMEVTARARLQRYRAGWTTIG